MTPAVVMQLFDPFFQVYDQNNGHKGTGLGLAICEKLINLMDGDIAVDSQAGLGSRFTIRIPLYGQQYIESNIPEYRKSYRIAVTGLNSFLLDFITRLLEHHDFNVVKASENETYDLMITDNSEYLVAQGKNLLRLSSLYSGELFETQSNEWLYNTYQLDKLPMLIDKFIVKLTQETKESLENNELEGADAELNEFKVLIVDDHPINRMLLTEQLASIGFMTSTAVDGLDALKHLEHCHADIVLSDVNMPNMDGYQLARALREQGFRQPIVALTANAMAEEKQRCLDAGMNDCLSKPTSISILRESLVKYVKPSESITH